MDNELLEVITSQFFMKSAKVSSISIAVKRVLTMLALILMATPAIVIAVPANFDRYDPSISNERIVRKIKVAANGSYEEIQELTQVVNLQPGVDLLGQEDFSYNSSLETLEVLEAYTILPDGKKIMVQPNAIRTVEDSVSQGAAMFSDVKHKIVVFSNVMVGAKTYVKIKRINHTPLIPGQYMDRTSMNPGLEYKYYLLELEHDPAIKIYHYADKVKGGRIADGPNGQVRYRYEYKQDVAKLADSFRVSYADFAPTIQFSTFKNYEDFAIAFNKLVAPRIVATPKVKELADQITKGISDPKEQAIALYNWVSREIRYVAIYLANGGLVPELADDVIKTKYGDCKGKSGLLIALLAAKGIPASMAAINAGKSYTLAKLGMVSPMNHAITYIPQWDIYVDPTLELARFGQLDYSEMDKPTVLLSMGKVGHTPNMSPNDSTVTNVKLKIEPNGEVVGTSQTRYSGYNEYSERSGYADFKKSVNEKWVTNHLKSFHETGTGKFMPTNSYDLKRPFELETEFTIDPAANFPGPGAITVPVGLTPGELISGTFEKPKKEVEFAFICLSGTVVENYQIEFPSNVRVTRIPTNVNFKEGVYHYQSEYDLKGRVLTVKRTFISDRQSMVCAPEEHQLKRKKFEVVQKDLRSQIFYE